MAKVLDINNVAHRRTEQGHRGETLNATNCEFNYEEIKFLIFSFLHSAVKTKVRL